MWAVAPWLAGMAGPALAALGGWTLTAAAAAFNAVRLGLYAFLVAVAWQAIIEDETAGLPAAQGSEAGSGKRLSSGVLAAHTAGAGAPARPRPHSPSEASMMSESADSVDDWSIWEAGSEEEPGGSEPGTADAPTTPAAAVPCPSAAASAAAHPAVSAAAGPRPPVTAAPVAETATSEQQQERVADAVLPTEVAALAADKEEKADMAGAAVMAGASHTIGPAAAAAAEEAAAGGKRKGQKRKKKPWLNRKVEALFKPYSDKYSGASYFIYKGFSRMGKRIERSSATLGKHLDGAIRSAGGSAVNETERLLKKWVKFAGVVAFLTVALLPLPSVTITIAAG